MGGMEGGLVSVVGTTSTTWPAANLAVYCPVVVTTHGTIIRFYAANGAVVSGNIDVGLYDIAGTLLVSSGSTPQAGTTAIQTFDTTDLVVGIGVFYLAVAVDNTTATIQCQTLTSAIHGKLAGFAEQTSAFPLPAVAALATFTRLIVPGIGASFSVI